MSIEIPFRRQFRELRKGTQQVERLENAQGADNTWHVFGSSVFDYEFDFKPVLPESNFPILDYVRERRTAGKATVALDMMSDGTALRTIMPDAGLSVMLTDGRTHRDKESDGERNLDLIHGDIYDKRVLQQMHTWLEALPMDEKAFNLILVRALGGLRNLPDDPEFNLFLLQKLWDTLSTDDGLLLITVPGIMAKYLPAWSKQLEGAGIAHAYCTEDVIIDQPLERAFPAVSLRKTVDSPSQLPTLPTK